jgi:hypothetical protein
MTLFFNSKIVGMKNLTIQYVIAVIVAMAVFSFNTLHAQIKWDGQFGGKIEVQKF